MHPPQNTAGPAVAAAALSTARGVSRRGVLTASLAISVCAVQAQTGAAGAGVPKSGPVLVMGVVPYLSARKLAELYEPLRQHLALSLDQPVVLESAPTYADFLARSATGRYDLMATSPYFGRLAQLEQGYVALARPLTDLQPLLVTRKSDGPRTLAELKGQTVTTSDALANLTLAAQRHLSERGLAPGKQVTIRPMGSHANSLAALERGDSVAAVISVTALKQVGGEWADRLTVLATIDPVTPLLYMVHHRMGERNIERLRQTMLTFANDRPEGKRFSEALGHGGLKPVSPADMAMLDPFVDALRRP